MSRVPLAAPLEFRAVGEARGKNFDRDIPPESRIARLYTSPIPPEPIGARIS